MTPVIWDPDAQSEFDDALARSPDPAGFRRESGTAVSDLVTGLLSGPRVPGTPCREFVLTRLPYRIIYRTTPAAFQVIAFAHHSRRSGYWKSRLRRP